MRDYARYKLFWCASLPLLSSCGPLDSIPYSPEQTPETWLSIQPFVNVRIGPRELILIQPSSTVLVYILGILAITAGLYFLRIQTNHRSRMWWGIALALWGAGALLAGTSYQAFSYEIKCAGKEFCSWSSWWEVFYLMFSVASVDAMVLAEAYACVTGKLRKVMKMYAVGHALLYAIVVIFGALIPVKFLISFELLLLVATPNVLMLFGLNGWRYIKLREGMDLALLKTWLWLGFTIGVYWLYLSLDITEALWVQGIWFSENDVLHIGLIIWFIYIALFVANQVKDMPASPLIQLSEIES